MALLSKLISAWEQHEATTAVFAVRAQAENLYTVLSETIANIETVTAGASFADVDSEIKSEGAEIINILNQAKTALDNHSDFINWRQ